MTQSSTVKPTAIVLAHPYEGRIGYFLAGLSHHYKLKIYFVTNKRFRFAWQFFYKWQYAGDYEVVKCSSTAEFLADAGKYDAAFVHEEAVAFFSKRHQNQAEVLNIFKNLKNKAKQLFWLELGEQSYFNTGKSEFWDLITGVVKGQVFKPEYEHLLKDRVNIRNFQGSNLGPLAEENENFDIAKYRNKIIPFPFTPSITEPRDLDFSKTEKIYDLAANTRTWGNGSLRYAIIKKIQENLPKEYIYSFDYDEQGMATNLPKEKQPFDVFIKFGKWGKKLLKLTKYGKHFYPGPAYIHNLSRSKCYLGLGWTFSSLRTADCWGAGVVLISFSFEKCDYGIPMQDGYNYVSIGERDRMSDVENTILKPGSEKAIMEKLLPILANKEKQAEIIKNQKKIYDEYFSSPQQFVKKIFVEKIGSN